MKKNKKSNIVIVLVVLLLALTIGYAAFSSELTITGTAKTKTGNWDVKFTKASISETTVDGDFDEESSVGVTNNAVTVNAVLQAPGDGANVTATIKNDGKLDAKLTKFTVAGAGFVQNGNTYTNGDIIVTVPNLAKLEDGNIEASKSRDFIFSVEWNKNATNTTTEQTANFTITFTYEQGGTTFTGTQSFNISSN